MYEAYWRLDRKPFESTSDPDFYYPSEAHQAAQLKLRYAVESGRGCGVLAGASGVGKTLIIHGLRRQLDDRFGPLVHLVFPQMSPEELLAYLADALRAPAADRERGLGVSVRRIERVVAANAAEGRHAVVVIDEAHLIGDVKTFETLRLMLNFGSETAGGLTLLLVGQPQLLPALDRMPALEERLAVKCLLRPMTLEETFGYVSHRLQAAGAEHDIFTTDALERLFELTGGNPRRVNRLCDLALLVGYAEEQTSIGPDELHAVSNELIAVAPD